MKVLHDTEIASTITLNAAKAHAEILLMECERMTSAILQIRGGGCIPNALPRKPLRNTTPRHTAILALDGDKWKPRPVYRTRQGGNGFGINYEQVMYTLNTVDKHIVAIL